jgi:death-on-curing protein
VKEPIWIDAADVHAFHLEMLSMFGGLSGVRDEGLLDSALSRSRQLYAYGTPSIFELAAEYAVGIVKNHPFLDGNKRAGFMAAALFLEVNGLRFGASEEQVVIHTFGLAAGEISGAEYATWLESVCTPADLQKTQDE